MGNGHEKVRALLDEDKELRDRIEAKVVEHLGMHPKIFVPDAEDLESMAGQDSMDDNEEL